MNTSKPEKQIDYIEMPVLDIARAKQFYGSVFEWKFEDYGPNYTSFFDGRLAGGFTKERSAPIQGLLLVIYGSDLAVFQKKIEAAGARSLKTRFRFQADADFISPTRAGMS